MPSTTWTPDELAAWLAVAVDDRRGHMGAGRNNDAGIDPKIVTDRR